MRKIIDERGPSLGSTQRTGQHIGLHRQAIHEIVALKDHTDVLAQGSQTFAIQRSHFLIFEKYFARRWINETVDTSEKSRLACTALAKDDHKLPGFYFQRHIVEGAGAIAINF